MQAPLGAAVVVCVALCVAAATASGSWAGDMSDPESWVNPPRAFGGLEAFSNAVLQFRNDRWDVVKDAKPPTSGGKPKCLPGTAYLVSDLCAMGHLTKDAAMLASWLYDHTDDGAESDAAHAVQRGGDRRGDPRAMPPLSAVLFTNKCMARVFEGSAKIDKRAPLFHTVLQHWFLLVLSDGNASDTLTATGLGGPGVTVEALSNMVEGTPNHIFARRPRGSDAKEAAPVRALLGEDLERLRDEAPSKTLCYEAVVKRGPERWRWFRTSAHAERFRRRMWHYFGLNGRGGKAGAKDELGDVDADAIATAARGCELRVTLLERDEDRHFGEARMARMLAREFGDGAEKFTVASLGPASPQCTVTVSLQKFDKIKGSSQKPPPHPEQLRILAEDTDVLVAAHGAGLASVVAMRPGTAVVELFPHNFRYAMYEELATLAGVHYIPFESPAVHPPRCCSARGGDTLPALAKPHDGNGVGARACKKCDVLIAEAELFALVSDALARVVADRYQL